MTGTAPEGGSSPTAETTGAAAAEAAPSEARQPATCEAAGERYIELYIQEARALGETARAEDEVRLARKKETFLRECRDALAAGEMTGEHLDCMANAVSIDEGQRCSPE